MALAGADFCVPVGFARGANCGAKCRLVVDGLGHFVYRPVFGGAGCAVGGSRGRGGFPNLAPFLESSL